MMFRTWYLVPVVSILVVLKLDSYACGAKMVCQSVEEDGVGGTSNDTRIFSVNYEQVEEIIKANMATANRKLSRKMKSLGKEVSELKATLREYLDQTAQCQGGFLYRRKCFFIYTTSAQVMYSDGPEKCAELGGSPANIINAGHQILTENYLRKNIPPKRTFIYYWLGMRYDTTEERLLFSDGEMAPVLRWHVRFPDVEPQNTAVAIEVTTDESLPYQGLMNHPPTTMFLGFLCEK